MFYKKVSEHLPFPKVNESYACKLKITNLREKFEQKIKELQEYIHNIQHGMHFLSTNEEKPIICSRLDFIIQ